jgi:hypothetical protein
MKEFRNTWLVEVNWFRKTAYSRRMRADDWNVSEVASA